MFTPARRRSTIQWSNHGFSLNGYTPVAKDQRYKSLKVLVVEDRDDMRRIIKTVLRHLGFSTIDEAANGLEAYRLLKTTTREELLTQPYHLIVCDWIMPEMTGIQLLGAVREDQKLRSTPFLMITSQGSWDEVTKAIESGVTDYIVKPITAEVLETKIKKIFARADGTGSPSEAD